MANNQHTTIGRKRPRLSPQDYKVAIFCVLDVEVEALRAMLDEIHDDVQTSSSSAYILGRLSHHNVVIALLPVTGNTHSSTVAAKLCEDFPWIRSGLIVGVGGGVPGRDSTNDVRLGDVVVGEGSSASPAVVQFDKGKHYDDHGILLSGRLNNPPHSLLTLVKKLKAQHRQEGGKMSSLVKDMLRRHPGMVQEYDVPGLEEDRLFEADYNHSDSNSDDCEECNPEKLVKRSRRSLNQPYVHYGTIGTSNRLIRSAIERDRLRDMHNILCVEMEAAGIVDHLPCLVVRGVCDYADSHKNKRWQPYAAATAAAYVKELLGMAPVPEPSSISVPQAENIHQHQLIGSPACPIPEVDIAVADREKYKALEESLKFQTMHKRMRNISLPLSRTCVWLKDQEEFHVWNDHGQRHVHHGFLWIKGKPGSGKSTLMKALLDWETKERKQHDTLSFFFNARSSCVLEKSSQGLYQSLTHQLITTCSVTRPIFLEHFSSKAADGEVEDWTIDELQDFWLDIASNHLRRPLVLLIDALDEGEEADVRQLVGFLEELTEAAQLSENALRICLSSRHYPHISIECGVQLVLEKQKGHDDDMQKYIQHKLRDDKSADMDKFREQIWLKSDGVFLWIVLVVPILNEAYDQGHQLDVKVMRHCLVDIPPKLDDLFENILAKNQQHLDDCLTALQWVLYSRTSLSITQLYLAVGTISNSPKFHSQDKSPERLARCLLDTTRGLTEISKSDPPTVQFIHETVREFLKKRGLQQIDPKIGVNVDRESHDKLKACCLKYIEACTVTVTDNKTMNKKRYGKHSTRMRSLFPLLEYAATYMLEHADTAECLGNPQGEWVAQFGDVNGPIRKWIYIRNTFQYAIIRRYTPTAPLLYIITDTGLQNLLEALLAKGFVDAFSLERYNTALGAACAASREDAVRALMQSASVPGLGSSYYEAALGIALKRDHESIARLLLQKQGHIEAGVDLHRNALRSAATRGSEAIVRLLVEMGPGSRTAEGYYDAALLAAVSHGHDAVAKLLLKAGANPNAFDLSGRGSALKITAENGFHSTVRLLVESGANVNANGFGSYASILSSAAATGNELTVRALLEAGADVNAPCRYYGTPLQAAAFNDTPTVMRILLDAGADPNVMSGRYTTALHAAAARGKIPMVRLLLKAGAHINAAGLGSSETPFETAKLNAHFHTAQYLIDKGATGSL